MTSKRVYGIDLGTTYSCISYVDEAGNPTPIQNMEGSLTTPSVVYFENESNIVVGDSAKSVASIEEDRVVSRIKRSMGIAKTVTIDGQSYRPEDISSFILRKLVRDAEQVVGEKIEDVVITHPAYFGINQRKATEQAGTLAGLNVKSVIPEPTAAAFAYGLKEQENMNVLVYDLGGGTFDVTIIHIEKGKLEVIATDGDSELGGADWDKSLAGYFARCFEEENGTPASELLADPETYQQLLLDAEDCKKKLSNRDGIKQKVTHEGDRAMVEVSRSTFHELTSDLLERTIFLTKKALEAAASQKNVTKIDKILLVGGSSKMPQVQDRVSKELPDCEVLLTDPDLIVAKGAALFGLKCQLSDIIDSSLSLPDRGKALAAAAEDLNVPVAQLEVIDGKVISPITAKSFGAVAYDGSGQQWIYNLIYVNDSLPASVIDSGFSTREEGQTGVHFDIMENQKLDEKVALNHGTLIGELMVQFGQGLPKGSKVSVEFHLDEQGLLYTKAKELTTGMEAETTIKTDSVRAPEELEQARERMGALQVS